VDQLTNEKSMLHTMTQFAVGETVTFGGKDYFVTGVGTEIDAVDPITGDKGMIEVTDEGVEMKPKQSPLPEGLEKMPMDPSKFDLKQKIAEFSEPTEHVLDVERSV
jgi:hypothetical protein